MLSPNCKYVVSEIYSINAIASNLRDRPLVTIQSAHSTLGENNDIYDGKSHRDMMPSILSIMQHKQTQPYTYKIYDKKIHLDYLRSKWKIRSSHHLPKQELWKTEEAALCGFFYFPPIPLSMKRHRFNIVFPTNHLTQYKVS